MTVNDFPYRKKSTMTCVESKLNRYYIFTREEKMVIFVEIFEGVTYKILKEFKIDTRITPLSDSPFANWLNKNKVTKVDIGY